MRRWARCAAIAAASAAALLAAALPVCAAYETPQSPMFSYNYSVYGEAVPAPDFCTLHARIGEGLSAPADIFVREGEVYVLDAGADQIAVYPAQGGALRRTVRPTDGGAAVSIADATGLFVQTDGTLYIALPKQQLVLMTDAEGRVLRRYGRPESSLIPQDLPFSPEKVAVQADGMLYVVSESAWQGLLQIAADGTFVGFFGSNTVTVTAQTVIDRMWRRLFSKKQQARLENTLPVDLSSVALGADGFIYTSTDQETQRELRKLSPLGNNVLAHADTVAAGVKTGKDDYGDFESYRDGARTVETAFIDLTVGDGGAIYALDATRGRVFVYDQSSHLLGVFGVLAAQDGGLLSPVAVDEHGGDVYVLDAERRQVLMFRPTAYGRALTEASALFSAGRFAEAKPLWEALRAQNAELELCADGLGWAALEAEDYTAALRYFREARDISGFDQAFLAARGEVTGKLFFPLFCGALAVIAAVFLLIGRAAKRPAFEADLRRRKKLDPFTVMLHPFAGYEAMKENGMGSLPWSLAMLAALLLSRMLTLCYTGFLFSATRLEDIRLFAEQAQLLAIVLGFVICSWAVGTLMDSEGTLRQMFDATAYALCPYILTQIAAVLLSNVIVLREQAFLTALTTVGAWLTAAGLLIGTIRTHRFSFGRAVAFLLLVLVGILFLLFLFLMFYSLVGQLWSFLESLYSELRYRL